MTDAQLNAKFRSLAGRALPEEQVERALAQLWRLDELDDVRTLFPMLAAGE